jgi:hypothetical protein
MKARMRRSAAGTASLSIEMRPQVDRQAPGEIEGVASTNASDAGLLPTSSD